ncbi:unnamed protein product [Rotaria sordida]|uniref:Uncharacterized protein n=1 Tax=Rotaria sordida TaxID=392033 RepID=A0A818QQS6_9BILA|nr:unnamed protein product [Rotaria sordida]CAF1156255.1 unnamed protein product [Rotaria sordida]CAF3645170.1 unnamed protein product [Rotaria sordida]CAF3914925.1 unnamed protein product [Rotaria sordida]
MTEENLEEDVLYVLHQLVEQMDEENDEYNSYVHICDDCSIIDSSVKRQIRSERESTTNSNIDIYLCDNCSRKRHDDAQKVLQDLEHLAHEVEQRLQAIENTERELDQWRDAQLQKNRDFWDEYRRQVENFSACRIRTLQYEYTMRQLKTQRIMKRLKCAKYIAENIDQLREQLHDLLQPSLIDLLSSDQFKTQFSLSLSTNDENENSTTTFDHRRELYQQLEELSCLDKVIVPGDDSTVDDEIRDEIDE